MCFLLKFNGFNDNVRLKTPRTDIKEKYTYISSAENNNHARGVAPWTVWSFAVVFYTVKIAVGIIRRQYTGERKITIIPSRRRERPSSGRPRGVGDWLGGEGGVHHDPTIKIAVGRLTIDSFPNLK